ncbi:MAG: hypothetical protein KUG78_00035 [Kangiellaceae bacterium]|nr:hypothetical protein [Kangiellaceae bacterium]
MNTLSLRSFFKFIVVLFTVFVVQACQEEVVPRIPSATSNVTVLEKELIIPGLNRNRKLRIYLPTNYETASERYPVLYMHDGQNLFDDVTSYVGEWGVDESLNELAQKNNLSLIVVGIDNGGEKRMNELSPWENSDFGVAEGKAYMAFIVGTVKPMIDKLYRTKKDSKNTAIMGSSMGGLISHYAAFEYPDIFSKVGVFSPSFWFSNEVYPFSQSSKLKDNVKLYYLMGGEEGSNAIENMNKMVEQLKSQGMSDAQIYSKVPTKGKHSESFWRQEFKQAILWLFED